METMASKNATFSPGSLELLDNDPFLSCYTPFELFNPFWAGPPGQKCVILHAHIESLWITFPEQKWLRESFNRASKKHVTLHSPGIQAKQLSRCSVYVRGELLGFCVLLINVDLKDLKYRARLKGFGQVWWILLTTPAWACLQHSHNLAEAF